MVDANTIIALRNSSKGQLHYNRTWEAEGRTKELLDQISINNSHLNISPKALLLITSPDTSLRNDKSPILSKMPVVKSPASILVSKAKTSDDSFDNDSYLVKLSETELPLLEYENERLQAAQGLYEQKKNLYEEFSEALSEKFKVQYERLKSIKEFELNQKKNYYKEIECQYFEQLSEDDQYTSDENSTMAIQDMRNEEFRIKGQMELEQELMALQDHLIGNVAFEIREKLASCDKQYLQTPWAVYVQRLMDIAKVVDMTISSYTVGSITEDTVSEVQVLIEDAERLLEVVSLDVYHANMQALQGSPQQLQNYEPSPPCSPGHEPLTHQVSEHQSLPQQVSIHQPSPQQLSIHQPSPQKISIHQPSPTQLPVHPLAVFSSEKPILRISQQEQDDMMESSVPEVSVEYSKTMNNVVPDSFQSQAEMPRAVDMEEYDDYIDGPESSESLSLNQEKQQPAAPMDPKPFHEYLKCIEALEWQEKTTKPFSADAKYKKYKLELHKAITTPINAISSCTSSHLRDKINRLVSFLSGNSISCGGKYISCQQDPLALAYCKKLIAEKLVNQGEEQVASQFSTAFPYAAVIVSICAKFPDIWPLVLGNLYQKCPYLVPLQPPQEEGQSNIDYFKSLGYKCDDGELEEKNKYLKRMSGLMRLYSAIMLTASLISSSHCHNLEQGWMWMARTLNMNPEPDITATLLFDFLDVFGHSLEKAYGKLFKKLLHLLCTDFFQKIKQVSTSGPSGPISRLEGFLQSVIKQRQISEPEGQLPTYFWKT